jgi:hypothetical protein
VKRGTDLHLAELEATVQFALSRLASLHERHLTAPSADSQAALRTARELWQSAKRELNSYRTRARRLTAGSASLA